MKALQVLAFVASTWSGTLAADGLPGETAVLSEPSKVSAPGREGLPNALQTICPDHLSSGALRLLDQNGNLVHWPVGARRSLAGAHSNAFSGEINSRTNVGVRFAAREPAPVAAAASDPAILAGLDPRVGSNLRLGNDPTQLPSTLRAQAEPHIARSPTNPDLLAATFQEGRFTDGGAVDCGYAISHDGGLSWSRALIPGLTAIVGGPYYRVSDPVAGIDLNDFVYLNTIGLLDSSLTTSAVLLNRSTNGGASFEPPVEAMRSADSSVLLDKNWMAVNTFAATATAGRIFLTITRFANSLSPIAGAFSDDHGRTWSPTAFLTPSDYSAQGSQPVFLPDGKLAVVFWHFFPDRVEVVISTNGGTTFNSPRLIANVTRYDAPNARDGVFLPSAATDRTVGHLFVTFQGLFQNQPRILFTKSSDGGATWTAPKPISDNPAGSAVFNPAIAASPDGKVLSVAFYDGRMNRTNGYLIDLFLAQSFDGGTTWEANLRLSAVSTDMRLAPLTSTGYMLGDYLGVAPSTASDVPALPVWVDTRTGDPDPFVARVGMAPELTFASWRAARFSLAQINDPLQAGPGADPDHDRVVNLLEYAFALNPVAADQAVFSTSFSRGATGAFTASYERVRNGSDLVYSWSASADLVNWHAVTPSNVVIITNAARYTETVNSTFVPSTAPHEFYRLGVSLKP